MAYSLYDAAVPPCAQQLGALAGIIDKAAAHCAAYKIEESALLQDRLYPDMRVGLMAHFSRENADMKISTLVSSIIVLATIAGSALAQQTTGTPGSPSATTTIDGKQIPAPEPKFGGVINETLQGSKTWWPPRIVPPKGAPNILLIMALPLLRCASRNPNASQQQCVL